MKNIIESLEKLTSQLHQLDIDALSIDELHVQTHNFEVHSPLAIHFILRQTSDC